MKKTKIFFGNQHVDNMYVGISNYARFIFLFKGAMKAGAFTCAIIWVAVCALKAGQALENIQSIPVVHAEITVEKQEIPAIMVRIAKCESGGNHYRNGQVLINATQDAGKYQINLPVWSKRATEMRLNLMNEKDNETFAIWLFENYGSEPWFSSKKCWSK